MTLMMMGSAKYSSGGSSVVTSPEMISTLSLDPPSPAHSDSSNSNLPPTSPSGQLRGGSKECGVCSDIAKSMHFGGLSCDSCKAFFRRSVQNNAYKGFSCPYEKNCVIGVSSRKACQYCRFQKCLYIGMEKSWVMSEEERRKMMEQRREKKQKQNQESSQRQHDSSLYTLSTEDSSEISRILSLYRKAYDTIPYDDMSNLTEGSNGQSTESGYQGSLVLGPWMTFCKRIAYFFSLFGDFAELSANDQALLLRTALTSAGIIMGSVVFESSTGKWAAETNTNTGKNSPHITAQAVEDLVPRDLINRVDKFFRKFQQICPDDTMAKILILVSLYSPELMGLQARERVQHLQERYIYILQNYVKFKFRERSSVMFPKAIVSLADIRELADRTREMKIPEKAASLFSTMLRNTGTGYGSLGNPTSGLSLSPILQPPPAQNQLTTTSRAVGPKNDPIYQRLMKVLDQTKGSLINAITPTFLPVIIQILKRLAQTRQEGRTSRDSLGSNNRKAGRLSLGRVNRSSIQRHKRMSVKVESPVYENLGLNIKEEIIDRSEDTILRIGTESSHSLPSESQFGHSQVASQELMETFPQFTQQHFHPPTICHPSTPPEHPHPTTSPIFHPISELSHHHHPDSSFMGSSQVSFAAENNSRTYPMSPDEPNFQIQSQQQRRHPMAMSHSPQPLPLTNDIQTKQDGSHISPLSPYAPPTQPAMSSFHVNYQPQETQSPYPSLGPSHSPNSSSSSSSSPDETDPNGKDPFGDSFSQTELEVIMRLLDQVYSFAPVDCPGVGDSGTEIIPLPLLKELQNKLCPLNNNSSNAGIQNLFMDDIMTSSEENHHSHDMSFGEVVETSNMDVQPTVVNHMALEIEPNAIAGEPIMTIAPTTPMDLLTDSMEMDATISMNNCT